MCILIIFLTVSLKVHLRNLLHIPKKNNFLNTVILKFYFILFNNLLDCYISFTKHSLLFLSSCLQSYLRFWYFSVFMWEIERIARIFCFHRRINDGRWDYVRHFRESIYGDILLSYANTNVEKTYPFDPPLVLDDAKNGEKVGRLTEGTYPLWYA